jgi:hypothetical protein
MFNVSTSNQQAGKENHQLSQCEYLDLRGDLFCTDEFISFAYLLLANIRCQMIFIALLSFPRGK